MGSPDLRLPRMNSLIPDESKTQEQAWMRQLKPMQPSEEEEVPSFIGERRPSFQGVPGCDFRVSVYALEFQIVAQGLQLVLQIYSPIKAGSTLQLIMPTFPMVACALQSCHPKPI